jgi:hypothetical protein
MLRGLAGIWVGHLGPAMRRRWGAAYLADVGPADTLPVRTAVTGSTALATYRPPFMKWQRKQRDHTEKDEHRADCRLHPVGRAMMRPASDK